MNRDLWSSIFWMGVGAVFLFGALPYGVFRRSTPGAGFFPFGAGLLLIALSVLVLVPAARPGPGKPAAGRGLESFFPRGESWRRIFLALAALFGYWVALPHLGFLLTTFLFMVFLLRFIDPQRWPTILTASLLTTFSSYMIFNVWLKVRLPAGILKRWIFS